MGRTLKRSMIAPTGTLGMRDLNITSYSMVKQHKQLYLSPISEEVIYLPDTPASGKALYRDIRSQRISGDMGMEGICFGYRRDNRTHLTRAPSGSCILIT